MITDRLIKENSKVEIFSRHLDDDTVVVIKKFKDPQQLKKEQACHKLLKEIAIPIEKYSDNCLQSPYSLSLEAYTKQPVSPLASKRTAIKLVHLLKFLHDINIVHGDLKPSNIFFNEQKQLKINDFETVQAESFPPSEGLCSGTPGYSAPEVWVQSQLNWLADQYSVGIIFCKLFCRQIPFVGNNPEEMYELQKVQAVKPGNLAPDLPPETCRVIERMCAFKPLDRYQDPNELLKDLENIPTQRAAQQILMENGSVVVSSQERQVPKWILALVLMIILAFLIVFFLR